MAKHSDESLLDSVIELLQRTPFWFGPLLAIGSFLVIQYAIPFAVPSGGPVGLIRTFAPLFAWAISGAIVIGWIIAEVRKLLDRRRFDQQRGLRDIRDLSWREFERLTGESFRRQGYDIELVGKDYADGGVDIRLRRAGELVLVQCKHWSAWRVGVKPVRELLGVVAAENASRGIIVTSGRFSRDAHAFARNCDRVQVVEGEELVTMIRQAQAESKSNSALKRDAPAPTISQRPTVICPKCGSEMVLRTARKGASAGEDFWGCRDFPRCRGTRPYTKSPAL